MLAKSLDVARKLAYNKHANEERMPNLLFYLGQPLQFSMDTIEK